MSLRHHATEILVEIRTRIADARRNGVLTEDVETVLRDAEAALQGPGPYRLAIVDYSLPGMDGLTLIDRLRRQQPDLPVILCSGLPMNPPVLDPPVHFVQKPYRPRQLAELVAELIAPAVGLP